MNITIDTLIRIAGTMSSFFFILFLIYAAIIIIKEKNLIKEPTKNILYTSWIIVSLLYFALLIVKFLQ